MKCPICGNEELQQHHRFCCNCGCRLDKKPTEDVQTEAPFLQNICPQTTTQEKTATADDQPSTEERLYLPAEGLGAGPTHTVKEGVAVADRGETNVFIEPLQQVLEQRAPSVGSEEPGKISLTNAGGDARQTTLAANSDLSEYPTRLDHREKAENKFKSEVTAEGISPLETSEDSPSGDALSAEKGGEQILAVKTSSEKGITDTKVFEASTTAVDISTEEALIADRPDEKSGSEVDDAAHDSDKKRDLQQPAEENNSLKQGGNGDITPEQPQSGNEKCSSSVGGGNRNDANSGDTQENKQRIETRGNVTPSPETGAEETATQECQEKRSMHVDGSVSTPPGEKKTSSEKGITETKVFEASTTAVDISTEEALIADRPDEKSGSEVDDAAHDSDKKRDLQQPAEENDSLKQGGNGDITPEQPQSGNEKRSSSVGGGNRNDANSGDTQENKQRIETLGNVTPPPQTGAEETATQECQEKRSMHVDGSVSTPPNASNKLPIQPTTETKDDADFNDGKKDLDQPSGNQKDTTSSVGDENKSGAASSDAQLNRTVTPLPEAVAKKTVVDEGEGKHGVQVDPSVSRIGAGTRPNAKRENPVQVLVETRDDAHANNSKKDLSQHSRNQSGNLTAKNKDKSKVPLKSATHPSGTGTESGKVHTTSGRPAHESDVSQTTANSSHTTVQGTGEQNADGNLTVIFHALLTPTFSVNFKQGDKVCLRGDAPFSWNASRQIEMSVVREVSSGYYLLQGKTKISMQQAYRNIPYKYVVVRAKKNEPHWECLIGFKPVVHGHVNRCLSIPVSSIKSNATWNQYDDAVFNQPSLWESICSNIPLFRNNAQDPAVEGRRMAMLAMFPDWGRISTEEGGMSAHTVLAEINKVVYSMSNANFENGGCYFPRNPIGFDVFKVLHYDYLSARLNINAKILQVQADEEESQNMRLITSVIIASLVVHHHMTFLRDDEVRDLLRCLALHAGDPERKTCSGFEAILGHFPKQENLRKLADSLFRLCDNVIAYRPGVSDWLFAVPLLHFLSRTTVPFSSSDHSISPPSLVKDDSWWGTQGMDFKSVRQRAATSSTSTPAHLFLQLTPLFDVDPLFKRTFLLTLPIRDITKILQRKMFSLHEVCWTLARVVEERDVPCLSDEEWDSLEGCIREIYDELSACDRLKESQSGEMASVAQATSQLLHHLLTAHGLVIRKRILVLSSVFQLLSKSIFYAKNSSLLILIDSDSKPAKASESKDETFNSFFHDAVNSLVVCLEKHFTGDLFNKSEARRQDEVQVWSNLLSVKIDDHELQLFWDNETRKALKCRIQQIEKKHIIELYCKLDLGSYHHEIAECLMDAAFEALETHVEVEIKEEDIASFGSRVELCNSWQDAGVGPLFALFLKRHWPKRGNGNELSQDEVLEHILSWKPMVQYLKYFGYRIQGRATLPGDGMELIVSASSLLGDIRLRLRNGSIDINTLRILQTNRLSFLNLCSLLSEDDVSAEPNVKSEASKSTENKQGTSSTGLFLDMRIEELEAFEKERDAVDSLVEMCSIENSVDVDLDEVKEKLRMNVSSCQVFELCHKRSNGQEPMVKFFELSAKCKWMIQVLHSIRASFLFLSFWHKCLQKAAALCKEDPGSNGRLTIEKVQELVWIPSQRRWRDLWERIINGEISLKEVDERFSRFRDDANSLDVETEMAMTYFADEEGTGPALRNRVDQIKQCFKLTECSDAAEVISDFQKAMGLKGDFQVLDDFQEQMRDTFNRRSLDTVSDDVLKMGRDLANLKQPQIKCLKTVIQCKDYIFWLREEVKGREEVKTLVDLAMMSAGESDIETDRVSFLHTTALGFAPFIFDLSEEDGFSQLMKICEGVWEEIKENASLPDKLEGIREHLEWLKGVKDAHAMSSLKLAKKINEEGVYCIGQLDMTKLQPCEKKTVDSVVNLLLPSTTNGKATFREYSLEKLRELQSKLALISGKQSSSGQDDVDKFGQILQAAVQLGQSYVNLCEIGDVSHLEWNREYQCKSTLRSDVISDMETQSKEFQQQYEAFKEHINSQRKKCPELNYFTLQQLLFLRKELAALRQNASMNNLNPQIYSLLEKVHPGIHQSSLKEFLQEAGIMSQNDDYEDRGSNQVPVSDVQDVGDHGAADDDVKIAGKYDTLLNSVEKLGFQETERLVVAALVADRELESSEADLVIWCVMNKNNDDLIDELYNEAKQNPRFREIINEDLPQPSQDSGSGDDNTSLSGDSEVEDSESSTSQENAWDETGNVAYLSLGEISVFLSSLASDGETSVRRRFPSYLKKGKPNLIMARKEHIFAALLALYMDDGHQSLPYSDEVLICTSETTAEEVELLWRRALAETGDKMYCLVRGDLLDYDVSQKAVDSLHTLMQDYRPRKENLAIVILCSSENEERAHIVASLEEYKNAGIPRYPQPEELRRYLEIQFKAPHERDGFYHEQFVVWKAAAEVERAENLNVRVVTSSEPGVGKSLVVQRLAEQVENLPNNQFITEVMKTQDQEPPPLCVTIPFHDKHAHVSEAVGFFLPHALKPEVPLSRVFHLDCSCTVTQDLDTLLFNLLILGELTDDRGRIWRKNPFDLYILEIAIPSSLDREKRPSSYRFLELLPSFKCLSPKDTLYHSRRKAHRESSPLFDEEEFNSEAVQRVWQYLWRFNEDPSLIQEFYFDTQTTEGNPKQCLQTLIGNCGVRNPSWSEIRYFVNFLNYQLRDCEQSDYCNPAHVGDTLEGFRTFVVDFMIIMSKDFAMRSLAEKEGPLVEEESEFDIRPFQLRRRWEKSIHPCIFFHPDHTGLTFLGFKVDPDGNLLDPQTGDIIKKIMSRHLRTGLHVNRVDLDNDFETCSKVEKIQRLCSVMGIKWVHDPDETYELTGDNVKKILAIYMRFRCGIPVIIMGETGCGKTRLIRYMCGLQTGGVQTGKNLLLMKIHGGTTLKDVERNVVHAEAMAVQNSQRGIDTVLFFDEANTTEALGMIKEVMVDRRCNGRPFSSESDRLKFIVACNPYRTHSEDMIQKLESAGLGYHVRAEETTECFGRIPLRHLVYRVHPLPESMRSLVWDFGSLEPDVEERYIRQIVGRYVLHEGRLPGDEMLVRAISGVLAASQRFMRNRKDECSFVSLRDVKRAMEVMVWFHNRFEQFSPLLKNDRNEEEGSGDGSESEEEAEPEVERPSPQIGLAQRVQYVDELSMAQQEFSFPITEDKADVFQSAEATISDDIDPVTWSLILALGVCYHARLQQRSEYREAVAEAFAPPCLLPGGPDRIEREIVRCQQAVMSELKLGPNIACNEALSENVFMMVVCIELRIPLFVVGKPGSSKSLAKAVVADNMQGDRSSSDLFKTFKQIQLVSHQCSPQSTPEGIEETFDQCSDLQRRKNAETGLDSFASVVVLDEVGLAEDSPKMPLKTLHPRLEDSDSKDDNIIETEDRFVRVAFIGLSNWALDPAKMNRGIMVSRNEPNENELEETARGICGRDPDITLLVEHLIKPLVSAYAYLYNEQKSLKRLQQGKKDEFFGLRDFYSLVKMVFHIAKEQKRSPNWQELEHAIKRNFGGLIEERFNPVNIIMTHLRFTPKYLQNEDEYLSLDSLNLIKASLDRNSAVGKGRYLLILTENVSALPRVKQLLLQEDAEEPYVIFGSSFPKDQLFTQVCRNINRVKICMETGRTVILLNLDNLYESLYDALNQYYVTFGGEKYVDLGLGNHRVKCRVHKEFRLIVIAEKDVVYNKFPIPLINRMEKHFLVISSGLTESQKQVRKKLDAWVQNFAEVFQQQHMKGRKFTEGDAFMGFHEDSVPAVVLQVCNELSDDGSKLADEERESWERKVLQCCQERLVQCATPDSVTRLRSSRLTSEAGKWWTTYFRDQEHSSLANFLERNLKGSGKGSALRVQISTHSRLLSDRDIPMIADAAGLPEGCVKCVTLQQFQTEQQFSNSIGRDFFAKLGGRESVLIVQCDSSDQTLDLVACSRHLVTEECREMEKEIGDDNIGFSHILMIVQLARVAGGCPGFISVHGEGWLSVHIDELCPPSEEIPAIHALTGRSVSTIFESALKRTEDKITVRQILTSCVQEAASRIEDDETTLGRATKRVEMLLKLLSPDQEDRGRFEMALAGRLLLLLQEKDQRSRSEGNEWLQTEALSGSAHETGTFKKALWRRFQSVVAPILAEVIAYVDRDGNLELADSDDPWVVELWLKILEDHSLTELQYADFILDEGVASVIRSKVPVLKSGCRSHLFQCKFPFSWLIKERMDKLLRDARSVAASADSPESETGCFRRLLDNSEMKAVLSDAVSVGGEAVVDRYLHDFAHMAYEPQDDDELEIIKRAITAAAKEIHTSEKLGGRFEMDLALVHTAHCLIRQRLNCLSLLLQAKRGVLQELLNTFSWDEDEMTVDAIALQMCLERMEPRIEDFEGAPRRREWCDFVLSLTVPVETIIGKEVSEDNKTGRIRTHCRYMWQRLSAVRMFIEHVYPSADESRPEDVQQMLKLWKALGDRTDFSKTDSLIVIERFLLSCSEDSIQRLQADEAGDEHLQFIQRCNAFFMALVSVFCFGEDIRHLDPDVFDMLMRFVMGTDLAETKQFSPFPGFGKDNSPVVRSFLLQQLINSSDEKAKKHLERFLYEAQGLSSEVPHILNVCLLTVQCMENSWVSSCAKNCDLDLHLRIGVVERLCQKALQVLEEEFTNSDELQVTSLEAIAKARYSLDMAAEFMYMVVVSGADDSWNNPQTREALDSLFSTVNALCASGPSGSPALYLLKQLVKRYGVHSIALISQNEEMSWIVPAEFQRRLDDGMQLDRFLVYGDLYRKVRDSLAGAILSENMDELIAVLEALSEIPMTHARDVILLLALYREVTVPRRMAQNQKFHPRKYTMIKDVILTVHRFLSLSARPLTNTFLETPQGAEFPFLPVDDNQSEIGKALTEVLIHATLVFQCIDFDWLLEPLHAILINPAQILDSYFPTMPEDSFHEARSAMAEPRGQWYECPSGHRYFVGDCGRPDHQRDCPECHEPVAIGGLSHDLVSTNRLASRDDRSNKRHILGAPQKSVAERDLSPARVSLLRFILNSAMLAGGCRQPEIIHQLIVPEVQADGMRDFLWEHLVNDVKNISTNLERSEDEVLLAIHIVLSEIVCRATNRLHDSEGTSVWSTKEGRKTWEQEFWNVFVDPFWKEFEGRLQNFYAVSVNDRRLGNDPLMQHVYEVDPIPPPRTVADIHPGHASFWRYRTRVTVDHVIRQFQDLRSSLTTCKMLRKFFDEESKLRAMCYLPDVMALQKMLTDRFCRRIDRERANQLNVRDFFQELPKGQKDNASRLFRSFKSAWDLVHHHLSSQGRFAPTKEECAGTISMVSPVSVLLTTSKGPGVCCKGLMFFLVNVQNELVQTYRNSVGSCRSTRSTGTVPLSEVSMSQLIAYDSEKDLLPVMLANCSYSLEVGKETLLEYNWEVLEKQICDRFIRGKPELEFEVEDFMFREDARSDESFAALEDKIPQEFIPSPVRVQILSELKDLRDVSDVISTLEITISFLSTAGGSPEMKISDYCTSVLRLSDDKARLKSKKAQQFCSLNHVLDLWRTLALARAKLLHNNKQDPFHEVLDCFKTEMPRKLIAHFSKALRKMDVELFLSKLVEVIILRLPQEEKGAEKMSLKEYLSSCFDANDEEDFPGLDGIPDDLCVEHVIYAWQLALEDSERDRGRRRSMMS